MRKIVLLLIIIILFAGCHPCKRLMKRCPPQIKDSLIYIETITEDPAYTIPDSVFWSFVIECDSNYQAILKRYNESNTGMNTEVEIKEIVKYVKDNKQINQLIIDLSAYTDSIEVKNKLIEKLRAEKTTVFVPEPYPEKYTPRWIKWIVIIFFVENALLIFLIVRKFKNKLLFWK